MIKSLKQLAKPIKRFHEVVGPSKAPKTSELMIWINVENSNGQIERIRGRIGESLFQSIRYAETFVGGFCDGGELWNLREKPVEPNAQKPFCALCFVEIGEYWYKKMDIHPIEKQMLENEKQFPFDHLVKRLSCCITIESWMNEMFVRIPILMPDNDRDIFEDAIGYTKC